LKRKKIRQLAKLINNGKEIKINFIFASADHFCYRSINSKSSLEISTFYYRLNFNKILINLIHEIGHLNTIPQKNAMFVSDYTAEYEANRWAMYRLDELKWQGVTIEYEKFLHELSNMKIEDDCDEEYQEAAKDVILELGLT